jgi:hypothetical protein
MEKSTPSRGRTSASASQPENGHFIKYEPVLVEQLKEAKPSGCKVSGRLLSLLYSRLLFWSRYSKHKGEDGKRYFWKSIVELSEEISYSTKQIERALYVLVELGMIIRDKLHKKYYKQVWFYHLPRSPHTAEAETRTSSHRSTNRTNSTEHQGKQGQAVHTASPKVSGRGSSAVAPVGAPMTAGSGSGGAPASNASIQGKGPRENRQNVCFISKEHSTRKNTLWEIVEKCELYGQQGIESTHGKRVRAGFGFG